MGAAYPACAMNAGVGSGSLAAVVAALVLPLPSHATLAADRTQFRGLAEQGLAVILISHNLHDVFEVSDRITVLRLGRNVGVYEREKTTQQEIVSAITAGIPTKVSGIEDTGVELGA